jgi:hypothetical protein
MWIVGESSNDKIVFWRTTPALYAFQPKFNA